MTTLQLFNYSGQEVRTDLIDGEPWFVASDVAKILGYRMASDMTRRLDEEDKGTRSLRTPSGDQEMTIISEPGLYVAVLGSQVAGAKAFKRWVTHEVLPAIRKTGTYSAVRELTFEEKMLEVMGTLNERVEAQRAQLAIAAPKAEAFDAFLSAAGDYDVRDAAQLLHREHGIEIGRTRLFKWLRANQWLDKANRPYQHRIDQGLLRIKASTFKFTRTNGEEHLAAPQVRITPKGLDRLRGELKESAA